MSNNSKKVIKNISKWPLSKVDIVEISGVKYIEKTIHRDFKNEYYRQKFLYDNLKWTRVPRVFDLKENENTVSFLMDFIEIYREVTDHEAIELLVDFFPSGL